MQKNTTDWHRADIVAELKKKRWSLRALSIASGFAPDPLNNALRTPYPKAERVIAEAIGVSPEAIWPQRYAARNFQPELPKSLRAVVTA